MNHPTHGPSTPGDLYEQGSLTAPGANGSETRAPEPPRPVFQRPAGYDTLSPASPYTVVFEPWPDTSPAREAAVNESVLPVQLAGEPPLSLATRNVAPQQTSEISLGQVTAEPHVLPTVEATQPYAAGPQAEASAPEPARTATQASAPGPEALASPAYASATAANTPVTEPDALAQGPGPSFVPTPGFGPHDPYLVSSNPEPDPYLALLRQNVAPPQFGSARPRKENVGRGLGMALIAVLGGCVLSAFVYHLGFVASIVALAMGATGIALYAKGAGAPPRKGAVALVVLLLAGILLAWVSSVGTELFFYYVDRKGTSDGAILFVLQSVLSLDLFTAMLKDFLIFVGFGVLGIFGVARRLLARRAR